MMTCQQCRDELSEYALGHPDSALADAVEAHLRQCTTCRRELSEIEEAWSAMPLALEPLEPAPATFSRIDAAIDDADHPRAESGSRWKQNTPDATAAPGAALRLSRRARLASYALAGCVVIGSTIALWSTRQGEQAPTIADADQQAVRDLAQRLGNLQQMERVLGSGVMKLASLHKPHAETTQAYVVWDLSARQWHFFALDLPPAPAGQAYQLWADLSEGKEFLAGPTFDVDRRGVGSVVADFPALDPANPARAVITLEPAGGSKTPTGDVLLEAPL